MDESLVELVKQGSLGISELYRQIKTLAPQVWEMVQHRVIIQTWFSIVTGAILSVFFGILAMLSIYWIHVMNSALVELRKASTTAVTNWSEMINSIRTLESKNSSTLCMCCFACLIFVLSLMWLTNSIITLYSIDYATMKAIMQLAK